MNPVPAHSEQRTSDITEHRTDAKRRYLVAKRGHCSFRPFEDKHCPQSPFSFPVLGSTNPCDPTLAQRPNYVVGGLNIIYLNPSKYYLIKCNI